MLFLFFDPFSLSFCFFLPQYFILSFLHCHRFPYLLITCLLSFLPSYTFLYFSSLSSSHLSLLPSPIVPSLLSYPLLPLHSFSHILSSLSSSLQSTLHILSLHFSLFSLISFLLHNNDHYIIIFKFLIFFLYASIPFLIIIFTVLGI